MNPDEYRQLQAFARIDGLYLALAWIVSFACYIMGLSSPMLSMLASVTAIASPFFAGRRLTAFRDHVREGIISFRRGAAYYFLIFFYASMLFALAQYVYLAFLDHGYLVNTYLEVLSSDEAKTMFKAYGVTKRELNDMLAQMQQITPVDFVLNVLVMNVLIGGLLCLPFAAWARRRDNQPTL